MPRKCGPRDQVDVAGRRVGRDGDARRAGRPPARADEGVVEADVLLAPVEVDRATGCPGRRCPCRPGRSPSRLAQHLVAQADREERLPALEQRRRPPAGTPRSSGGRRRAGRRARGRRSPGRSRRARRRRSPRGARRSRSCPSTARTCRSMFTKSSSPSRTTTVLPLSSAAGGGAGLVGQPEPAQPLVARAERDQHVLVARQLGDALGAPPDAASHEAEGA